MDNSKPCAGSAFSDSLTVTTEIITPALANGMGNAHGGEIVKIMDNTAGISAMKYAQNNCVTARIDGLIFYHAVHIGDIVECAAQVVYVGNTSMQIYVTLDRCNVRQETLRLLSAFFTMVAVDREGKPTPVPPLPDPVTAEEKDLYAEGKRRAEEIAERRRQGASS